MAAPVGCAPRGSAPGSGGAQSGEHTSRWPSPHRDHFVRAPRGQAKAIGRAVAAVITRTRRCCVRPGARSRGQVPSAPNGVSRRPAAGARRVMESRPPDGTLAPRWCGNGFVAAGSGTRSGSQAGPVMCPWRRTRNGGNRNTPRSRRSDAPCVATESNPIRPATFLTQGKR